MREELKMIITYAVSRNARRFSIENQIETEVARYLSDTCCELKMLDDYRCIRAVFFKFNTTLSSSAPVERVFSQTMMIFTPRRNRLSADNFERTLILKHNRMLLNNQSSEK